MASWTDKMSGGSTNGLVDRPNSAADHTQNAAALRGMAEECFSGQYRGAEQQTGRGA